MEQNADIPTLLSLGREQQYAAVQLSHYVYTLLCIIQQLMTTNERLVELHVKTNSVEKINNKHPFHIINVG